MFKMHLDGMKSSYIACEHLYVEFKQFLCAHENV